jgi:hypothetical protein
MTLRTAWIGLDGAIADEAEVDDRVCDCCPISAVGRGSGAIVVYRDRTKEELRDISVAWLDGGRWSEPAPVHGDGWKTPGCPVNGPAMDGAGDRLAVAWFSDARDSARALVAFSSDRGRSFAAPIRIDEGNPLGRMSLVMLEDGSALVGWVEQRGSDASFETRRVRPSGEAGPTMTIARLASSRAGGIPRMVRSRQRVYFAWTAAEGHQVHTASARLP